MVYGANKGKKNRLADNCLKNANAKKKSKETEKKKPPVLISLK